MHSEKQQARRVVSRRLSNISQADYRILSEKASAHLIYLLKDLSPRRILAYQAVEKWHEVTLPAFETILPGAQCDYVVPHQNALFPQNLYDVVIVPLYGFSKQGYRLGHGVGWYDRLLSKQPHATIIGIGFECSRVDFTAEAHDVSMDIIVTELQYRTLRRKSRLGEANEK